MLAFALLAFALALTPALASDPAVTFQCCAYTPNNVRIVPGQTVTWQAGAPSVDFQNISGSTHHPLHFVNPAIGDQTDASTSTTRPFDTDGVYLWYCGNHGHYENGVVSGMSGRVVVTLNHLPVPAFTASATDVPSGTAVTFDASTSSDPDPGQFLDYAWDLDGDGANDPGQTALNPSHVYTNSGTTPSTVTVRLTATDTNNDAVGPESATRTMAITVEPAPAGSPPPVDSTAPVVKLTLAKSLSVRSKLTLRFTTSEPASVTATLKAGARRATASRDFGAAGPHTLALKLSTSLRRYLHKRRSATLTMAVSDDAGNGTTLRRTLKLRARVDR